MSQFRNIRPIGFIEAPFKQKYGTPRQSGLTPSCLAKICLDPELNPPGCLEGLEEFSHLWIIFQFHKNTNETISGKVHPPRLDGKKIGLYATRSPHRPNPLGLSVAKIERVLQSDFIVEVSGLDVIDQTPLYDIKPYIGAYDTIANSSAGWTQDLSEQKLEVHWSEQGLKAFEKIKPETLDKAMIQEFLSLDPRSVEDREKKDSKKTHKVLFGPLDIHFKIENNELIIDQILLA